MSTKRAWRSIYLHGFLGWLAALSIIPLAWCFGLTYLKFSLLGLMIMAAAGLMYYLKWGHLEIILSLFLLFVGYRIAHAANSLNPWLMALFVAQGYLMVINLPFMLMIGSQTISAVQNLRFKGTVR